MRNNWIDELRLVDVQKTHLGMRMYFVFLRKLYCLLSTLLVLTLQLSRRSFMIIAKQYLFVCKYVTYMHVVLHICFVCKYVTYMHVKSFVL